MPLAPVTRENVRAICDLRLGDGQDRLVAPEVDTGTPYLVRFMIDAAHQGRGLGREAVAELEAELRAAGWTELEVSFNPVKGGARGFWERCGFADTGRIEHGEPRYRKTLQE